MKSIRMAAAIVLALAALMHENISRVQAADVREEAQKYELNSPRTAPGQTATRLSDGRWLLLGGRDTQDHIDPGGKIVTIDGVQTPLMSQLTVAREFHSATVLPDGNVLIIGGTDRSGKATDVVELFHPDTQLFESLGNIGLVPRAQHTATLLTDGSLLIAGGVDNQALVRNDAELLDTKTMAVSRLDSHLLHERFGHLAELMPSDYVLMSRGKDHNKQPVSEGEVYSRKSLQFLALKNAPKNVLPSNKKKTSEAEIVESIPSNGAEDVPVSQRIALRFSKPMLPETISPETITLIGPGGAVESNVISAELGLLAFLTPKQQLTPATSYTLFAQGVSDRDRNQIPFSAFTFKTTSLNQENMGRRVSPEGGVKEVSSDDEWIPGGDNLKGVWRSGNSGLKAKSPPKRKTVNKALYGNESESDVLPNAAPGVTALAGQVLKLNGLPLANVTLAIGAITTITDSNGEFLLEGIPAGPQALVINGATADHDGRHYGRYEYMATIEAGKTTALPFVIWMTKLDTHNQVSVASPTTSETIVRNPRIPGLELRIPSGTVIRDSNGNVVTQISMTAIPVDQPPFPLPNFPVPVYFTIQPGGAHLQGTSIQFATGAQLIYPNFSQSPPGTRIDFWNYDPQVKGWYVYGQGTVTEDGKQVMPDPGVAIYEFTGAMIALPSTAPAEGPPPGDGGCNGPAKEGDPVDCYTGLFLHEATDLVVNDVIPLVLSRSYRPRDTVARAFGIGTNLAYDYFLVGDTSPWTYQDLILPDGGRVHFTRISAGAGYTDAVYSSTSAPGKYFGATLRWVTNVPGSTWMVQLKDGTALYFPESYLSSVARCAAVNGLKDRFGNTLTFTRDSSCNLTRITSPNGRKLNFVYTSNRITQASDDAGRTVIYQYDPQGRLAIVTDPLGNTESYTYDSAHRMLTVTDKRGNVMVTNTYDSDGRVTQQQYADGSITSFNYTLDSNGKVVQTDFTDERGTVKRIQFNGNGYPISTTSALGKPEQRIVTITRDTSTNLVQSEEDGLGRTTTYQYDGNGNVTQVTQLAGTANAVTWNYTYSSSFSLVASVTDPANHTTNYFYDGFGNVTRIKDPLNNNTDFTYNSSGQIFSLTRYAGSTPLTINYSYVGGDLAGITDPLGHTTQFFTDEVGRVRAVKDSLGNIRRTSYDLMGRVVGVVDPLGRSVQMGYDANGNMTSFTDGRGQTTQYTYDSRNRLASKVDARNQGELYSYDAIGNLTRAIDRKGQVRGFVYDHLNRLVSAGFGASQASPTSYLSSVSYTWDLGDRLTQVADSSSSVVSRNYDGLNRLLREQTPQGQVDYSYYPSSLRQSMTVQGQPAVNYVYDSANRLTQISQGTATVSFSYDTANRRTTLILPSGIQASYGYDNADQLVSLVYQQGATVLGDLNYSYDGAGQRTAMGGSLAQVSLPTEMGGAVFNVNNQLTSHGAHALSYDANGSLVGDADSTSLSYVWDERGRLVQIESAGVPQAGFQYDALNRRTGKTVGSATTNFLHDGWQVVQELNGVTPIANLLSGLGPDEIYHRVAGATANDYLTDALGSTVALTDAAGAIQTTYSYDAYGNTTSAGAISTNTFHYAGRDNDGTGLYYYRNRYYDPRVGRFISEDPVGLAGGENLYAYVDANPISLVDPMGLSPTCHLLKILNSISIDRTEQRNVQDSVGLSYNVLKPIGPEIGLEIDVQGRRLKPSIGMAFEIWRATTFLRTWDLWQVVGLKQQGYYECVETIPGSCGTSHTNTTFQTSWDEKVNSYFLGSDSALTTSYRRTGITIGF